MKVTSFKEPESDLMSRVYKYRYVILALCTSAALLEYATRTNINNAIVSMVSKSVPGANSSRKSFVSNFCPIPDHIEAKLSANASENAQLDETFDWDSTTQGAILGAFFYGYIILQIPAGRMAEIFGGKWIVFFGILTSGLVNILTPFLAKSGVGILISSRVLLGIVQGGVYPACFSLVVSWCPKDEKAFGFGLVNVGGNLGAVSAAAITGYLAQHVGWKSSFYTIGGAAVTWTLLWIFLVQSTPETKYGEKKKGKYSNEKEEDKKRIKDGDTNDNSNYGSCNSGFISDTEVEVSQSDRKSKPSVSTSSGSNGETFTNEIEAYTVDDHDPNACAVENIDPNTCAVRNTDPNTCAVRVDEASQGKGSFIKIPWHRILRNRAVLACICVRFGGSFAYLTLQTKLPGYLQDILHIEPSINGILNSMIYISVSSTMAGCSYLSEVVIKKRWLTRTNTRKSFSGAGLFGLFLCFMLVPSTNCNEVAAMVLLIGGAGLYGVTAGGDNIVPAEVSRRYPTTIYALVNMCANFAGMIAPLVIGVVLNQAVDGPDLKHKWDLVFYGVATLVAITTMIFVFCASAEFQDDIDRWDEDDLLIGKEKWTEGATNDDQIVNQVALFLDSESELKGSHVNAATGAIRRKSLILNQSSLVESEDGASRSRATTVTTIVP